MKKYLDRIASLEYVSMYNEELLNDEDSSSDNSPEAIYINKQICLEKSRKIHEALDSVIESRYKKTKPLICALFTARCLNERTNYDWLDDNFAWINEYIDRETLDFYKAKGRSPSNKDIYHRFKPNVKNPDQAVSPHYSKFMEDFETALKERNIKFFL